MVACIVLAWSAALGCGDARDEADEDDYDWRERDDDDDDCEFVVERVCDQAERCPRTDEGEFVVSLQATVLAYDSSVACALFPPLDDACPRASRSERERCEEALERARCDGSVFEVPESCEALYEGRER